MIQAQQPQGLVIWFTGLSGAGKTTLAQATAAELQQKNRIIYHLDGDIIRKHLNSDLGFSIADRKENIRRITEIAALFKDAGLITLVSCISPLRSMRAAAKKRIGHQHFYEIYVKASLATCRQRDPKGLYATKIKNFTGIDSAYEEPQQPELIIDTEKLSITNAVKMILQLIINN